MHDHCINPNCGAVLRVSTIHFDVFNGWCCIKCGWQLLYAQRTLLMPKPAPAPAPQRKRWWHR